MKVTNMLEIKFKQSDIDELEEIINSTIESVMDPTEFLKGPALKVMERIFAELFRNEGLTKRTARYKEVTEETKRARYRRSRSRRKKSKHKILWDTGRLRDSYVKNPTINIAGHTLEISSDVPYAKFHETGTRYMPARSVLTRAQIIAIARLRKALAKWIQGKIDGK